MIITNVTKVQPSTSDISAASSNQYIYSASPTHPTRKTSTQKSILWRVWLHHIIWKSSEFAVHQKRHHFCEYRISIASIYDLNQHISRFHDNCPIICKICSKPFNNRQTFATHKFIKHSANSHKTISIPCAIVYLSTNTISRGTYGDRLTGITSKSAVYLKVKFLTGAYNSWFVLNQYAIIHMAKHS